LFKQANAKLYWDEMYFAVIIGPYQRLSQWLANKLDWEFWHNNFHEGVFRDGYKRLANLMADPVADPMARKGVDGAFLGLGQAVNWVGARLRGLQTGYVRTYAFTMLLGVLFVLLLILLPLLRGG
jgi:NADH:ubiquinone oxidoreductase subunit 5 (subunit L)/multisubunit Na+/H+ antiporter MnhA subunit